MVFKLSDKAIQGIEGYNRFIRDTGYSFSSCEFNDGYKEGFLYTISDDVFSLRLESYWGPQYYPDVNMRHSITLDYKGKTVSADEYDCNFTIDGKDSFGIDYSFCDGVIYDQYNLPIFKKGISLSDTFESYDGLVTYNIESGKVYLGLNGEFEIDYSKDIQSQIDEYVSNHYPTKYIRNHINSEVSALAEKYDYKLGDINSLVEQMVGEFQLPVTYENEEDVKWAIMNIKGYYKEYLDSIEYEREVVERIKKINGVLEGISDIVNDEYRKIPGSHVLTEEERKLVTERSKIRIRENKELANKNSRF